MSTRQHWLLTADDHGAALFSCRTTPRDTPHIDPVRSLTNTHNGEHERRRPSLLGGAERRGATGRSSASAAPHSVSFGHGAEEERRRFARDLGTWLAQAAREIGADRLIVFAPARLLGLLREEIEPAGNVLGPGRHVAYHPVELSRLHPGELAVHPAVLNALDLPTDTTM
jgi:protein required for attachment to host cells